MSQVPLAILEKERLARRTKLTAALQDEEDPLAFYEDFIKWTTDSFPHSLIPQSGLLELLEEAGRQFKSDPTYKGDRRYLKIWLTYARYVEDDHDGASIQIYKFLLQSDIGTSYAQLYEDYAASLERLDRRQDAEKVFSYGIKRRARPVERLRKSHADFQSRASNPKPQLPASSPVPLAAWKNASAETQALRRYPLKNYPEVRAKQSVPSTSSSTVPSDYASSSQRSISKHGHDRYAHMLSQPAPGRRPEKLGFNLSLLFTDDGTEYSVQEARAKSMGLLGKKWPPPPPPEPPTPPVVVRDDAESPMSSPENPRTMSRPYAEPTVTLATKEALADVFGMYNSPERTLRFGAPAGSKHAPVRKVEPVTPMMSVTSFASSRNENSAMKGRTPGSFQPLVDENASARKERSISFAAEPKLPAVSENTPTVFRDRRVLSAKDAAASSDENAAPVGKKGERALLAIPEDKEANIFQPVFTPVAPSENRPSAFARKDDEQRSAAKFTPFVDRDAQPSRPTPPLPNIFNLPVTNEHARAPKPLAPKPAFVPFVDAPAVEQPQRRVLGESSRSHTPLQALSSTPSTSTDEDGYQDEDMGAVVGTHTVTQDEYDDFDSTDQSSDIDDAYPPVVPDSHTPVHSDDAFDEEEEDDGRPVPMGGRLGRFNVMTPITERTLEYTHTTAAGSVRATPNDGGRYYLGQVEAKQSADMLAAQLANADALDALDEEDEDEGDIGQVEERTGTLSLSDALAAASSFRPPNPCNPFEAPIIAALLSFIPADADFQDLRAYESNQLDALQKFARKKSRRASGNSSRDSLQDSVRVTLNGRNYEVLDKLGEGGFGAVFEAVDLAAAAARRGQPEGEDEDDFDSDEDEDEIPKVALKVVKPRNLWEFHVLRRIHLNLPARLKRSIIMPETLYAFRDESFLILELCKQGTLLDVVNNAAQAGITQQGACLDELLVMFFAIELLRLIEGMHKAGFIHGDVKIDNCLLRLEDVPGPASAWTSAYQPSGEGGWGYKGIKMIDFGRTIDVSLFPAGQRFVGDWDPDARDCLELREGKPWTYQTDYFGLAGIIYCMLYGKYIEAASITPTGADGPTRYKLSTPFKRYWQGDLWTRLFDVLLNSALVRPDGKLPLCEEIGALRGEMETWLQANCNRASNSLKGLLKKVDLMTLGGKDGR